MKKRECVIVSEVAYPHLIQEDSDTMRQILILALVLAGASNAPKHTITCIGTFNAHLR